MSNIDKLFIQKQQIDALLSELVTYANNAKTGEIASSSYDDFSLFVKWKFHLYNEENKHISLFSIVIREVKPGIFTLQDVNDDFNFDNTDALKQKALLLLERRINLIQKKRNEALSL